ncbi:MAG: hypothetical protein H6710_19645 [Myxococcales bacterium]|nr:hypothetical protein [Myxococcales bacterium]
MAADKAGRSIVPIAILGAVAVAVVLFVWPGVLRERGNGPSDPQGEGVGDPPKTTSPEVASQGSDVVAPSTGGQVVAESGAEAASAGAAASASAGEAGGDPAASAGVADSGVAPTDGPDLVVLVGKLELAAAENRWRTPADDNVALHLARIEAIDPKHESIERIQKQAAETLKARAEVAAGAKHWHDAVEAYRDLYAISPEFKAARKGFGEALTQEAKILRLLKDPEQMLQVADDMLMLDAKSFEGQMMRGEAYEALSKWREATEAYAIAKRLKPKEKAASEGHARVEKKAKAMGILPAG